MKIGFLTRYSEERVKFAKEAGSDCLELNADPGSSLDFDKLSKDDTQKVRKVLSDNGIEATTLICSVNHLDPDDAKRQKNIDYFVKVMERCKEIGTSVISCNTWGDRDKPPRENLAMYKEVFSHYAEVAEKNQVKIAMENCPHAGGYPLKIGNIGYSPEMWDLLFEAVPSETIGLEYDPSHLVWLGIDYIKAIRNYGDRIYAVHAKDTEILQDQLAYKGIFGRGWWRYRIPGWGMIDWKAIFCALNDVGYDDSVVIEHEDPVFGGERTDEGLKLGLRFLNNFTV